MSVHAEAIQQFTEALRAELGKVLVGQKRLVDRLLIALLTGGHVLLEGLPGLAKTLAARVLAAAVGAKFQRVQFTPDLLPADLLGTEVYSPRTGEFTIRRGPVFTQILLADEINRAPAKVQSALLEAMQERQVTLGQETMALPQPFLVLATQNPIEHEGTYPLPEAQVDRFLLKIVLDYPEREEERRILRERARTAEETLPRAVTTPEQLLQLRPHVDAVHVESKVEDYILDLVRATRDPRAVVPALAPFLQYGAGPRATIALTLASKAHALLAGRDYLSPHDVKSMAPDVLRHRLILSFEAEAEGRSTDSILAELLRALPVP